MWFWVLAYLFLAFGVFLILAFANCLPGAVRVNWEWRPQMLGFAPSPVILSPTNYYKDIDIFLLILFYFEILISSFWMKYPATKIYSYLNIPRYCPHTNKQWRYLYFLFKNDVLPPRKYVYIHQSNQKIDDNLKKLNTSALYPLKQWPLIATFFVGLLQVDKQTDLQVILINRICTGRSVGVSVDINPFEPHILARLLIFLHFYKRIQPTSNF